jgi:uncharacterized integral membrane protein (TIGR00698 family)
MNGTPSVQTGRAEIKITTMWRRNPLANGIALAGFLFALAWWGSPPTALLAGILYALLSGRSLPRWNHSLAKWLLQACVVLLGFGMNLPEVLRLGQSGAVFASITIGSTLVLGYGLGRGFGVGKKASLLIASGTAVCGGSAIAAVSAVIAASEVEIAVSIGTVFLMNALALYLFPAAGHWLHLSQTQFGLWAGVAIHDISSVVGAGICYGPDALLAATAVKLSRTLWILPLTLGLALGLRWQQRAPESPARFPPRKAPIPWFIGAFLLASLLRSSVPTLAASAPQITAFAQRGMVVALFLIGRSLSLSALRAMGWRAIATGCLLWLLTSLGSLWAIQHLRLNA